MNDSPPQHISVLLAEVVSYLNAQENEIIVDGTFGGGGYTRAILESSFAKVIGIDRDAFVLPFAAKMAADFKDRFQFLKGAFSEMKSLLAEHNIQKVNGIVLDIGVSSFQIDDAARGFSFQKDGPLDMRMDQNLSLTAADVVNTFEKDDLADIFFKFGDERHSRRVAAAIVKRRAEKLFETTLDLQKVIEKAIPFGKRQQIDPATRCFQALRIYVNGELNELRAVLDQSLELLAPGGRLVVVTFHSLEDTIVKHFLKAQSTPPQGSSRYVPEVLQSFEPRFKILTKKAVAPSDDEVKNNVRARSAKLRAAVKL